MPNVIRNPQEIAPNPVSLTCIPFGGISILAMGDLYQLPPVGQSPIFCLVSDSYTKLYGSGSLWVDNFQMIELNEIVRQRDDSAFCELCRVRTAGCTSDDISILKYLRILIIIPLMHCM